MTCGVSVLRLAMCPQDLQAALPQPNRKPSLGGPLSNLSRAQTLPRADPFPDEEPPTGEAALSRGAQCEGSLIT